MPLPFLCLMTALPTLQAPAPANDVKVILDAARAKANAVREARAAHVQAGKNTKDFRGDCSKELADLDARIAVEKRPDVRQALLVSKLFHLSLAKIEPDKAFQELVRRDVPATASVWSLDSGLLTDRAEFNPTDWNAYVAVARTQHPDPAIRRYLLLEFFRDRVDAKDEAAWKATYATLTHDFPDGRELKQADDILASEKKTGIGVMAPAFSLPALGDARTVYTLESFKGRYVLIDFWATWCPSCRAEMPAVHAAWAKFKDKSFDILSLSFDRRIEHIAPYRQEAKTPMPWKHAFIEGGFKNPLAEAYGVKGIPKALLIGPDGKIVASGSQLLGANLEKTLGQFLGK